MSALQCKTSHLERTATEPRNSDLHNVIIQDVQVVSPLIRLFRLSIPDGRPIKFLSGQWLDTYVPSTPRAGGFTITSTPAKAECSSSFQGDIADYPYLELAIQRSPSNPPAVYLFHPIEELLGIRLQVRVGGSFVFPPMGIPTSSIRRVIFLAGGVGINPLISMVSHIAEMQGRLPDSPQDVDVQFLYSSRLPQETELLEGAIDVPRRLRHVLFLQRLATIFAEGRVKGNLRLFFTGDTHDIGGKVSLHDMDFETQARRIGMADVKTALGSEEQKLGSVVYVCGVPRMTDSFVGALTSPDGLNMDKDKVFFEKWW